jgi:hypothetical protein
MKKTIKIKVLLINILALSLFACSEKALLFTGDPESFQIKNSCVSLVNNKDINISGTVWYDEDDILHTGEFGLHWQGNDLQDTGLLTADSSGMIISSNGKNALFPGYQNGVDILDAQIYTLNNRTYNNSPIKQLHYSPILTENSLLETDWDFEKGTITVITTDLTTGAIQENTIRDRSMSSEPAPKIASNGILTYVWYQNYEGPRLVVYDTKTNTEIARHKDILYQLRPSWYGYLLNPQGTHILSISSLSGEGYDGAQQELFGVEIGKEPVQITNFHSKYPYTRIYDINFGGQRWSPDNRWIVLNVLPSESRQIDSSVDPSWLFLIDLEKNIGYQICQQINPKDQHSITWSPDSRHFALSINDKIWVIDPKTLESRLLVEKPGIPLRVLGWITP